MKIKNTFTDRIEYNYVRFFIIICSDFLPKNLKIEKKYFKKKSDLDNMFPDSDFPESKYYIYINFAWDWTKRFDKQAKDIILGDKVLSYVYKNKSKFKYAEIWNKIG